LSKISTCPSALLYKANEISVPGKLDVFGLGWEQVSKINPRLVYCSVTGERLICDPAAKANVELGYGSSGPYARNPGYDVVIEAEAGLMHITGEKGGRPVKVSSCIL
jgi:succinate--hydroxymethylglutarate CoA-transferase